jgi:flagellar hook-basal body complex protein FliE
MQAGLEALGAVQSLGAVQPVGAMRPLVEGPGMYQIGATAGAMANAMASATASPPTADVFGRLMSRGIEDLNASVSSAESAMSQLATGKAVELQDVMIRLERARISVQAFVQVRNKLVESYQDLMRMQL